MTKTITETADRIRITDVITLKGRKLLVEDITDAQRRDGEDHIAYPGRLAFHVTDPAGSFAQTPRPVYIYAGDTVTFRPGSTHLTNCAGIRPGGIPIA